VTETSQRDADATRRTLRWLFAAQIALAVGLVVIDIAPKVPRFFAPSSQPDLDAPTRPGDQTRRYKPRNPAQPGPGIDPDMPRRLIAEVEDADGVVTMRLRGAIAPGDSKRIIAELREKAPSAISLNSPGGSVSDALDIGRVVREIGADTDLQNASVCFSACPYIFAAGVDRKVAEQARLGVHQHSFGESTLLPAFLAVDDIQRGQAEVLDYLDTMGIDLRIMGPAMATPADEIYVLTQDELQTWNVVTE